jgi:hypothetical protein
VDGQQALHGFDFNDMTLVYKKVDPISAIKRDALVKDGNLNLPFVGDLGPGEFDAEALLLSRLQKAWAQMSMNLDG